jgi:TolA-binding protein
MNKRALTIILLTLILSGCGNDQYGIERAYWKVNRQAAAIFKNPVATPPNEVARVIGLLNKFALTYPMNNLAARAEFSIAKIYLAKGMHDQARIQLKAISKKYAQSASVVTECLFLTGSSYQMQNNDDEAVAQFRAVMSRYPLSPRGLQMPIYIAQYYRSKHDPAKMQEAYRTAIFHYQGLAQKDMKSALALRAYMLIAECYAGLKDWPQSIAALETIIANFKDKAPMDGVMLNIAVIYQRELHDLEKAKILLAQLVKDYPGSRYSRAARQMLEKK